MQAQEDQPAAAADGRPLGQHPHGKYSSPYTWSKNTPMELSTAQREANAPKNTDQLTADQARDIAAIEARRTQAGVVDSTASAVPEQKAE